LPQLTTSIITMPPNHKDIYVEALSTLRMGLPVFEPSIDVQLGDIGFMDENDGLFHKLYNVADPPKDIHGCPPAVTLVKGAPRQEKLDAIHLKLHSSKGSSCCVKVPQGPMGTLDMGFQFSGVHGHESILIPGNFIVKEGLEELKVLREYMTEHHQWIRRNFATRHDFKSRQLILVVGTVKTNSWAIAVTSKSEIVENLSFTISSVAKAKVWGKWSRNLSVTRCGPYMTNDNKNTTTNQTLFIRRIALRSDIPLRKKAWAPTHAPRTFFQRLLATLDSDDS